ncbi:DUF305 domain-containing protein [Streptomyces sp. SP18CS02]|uniref:DUF305 domain-containing protein n=1 Tax=Streptomyces sp. SP18CS02 TaxID=3002531 RepID=UPI002E783FBC|nr:DUF305 domain-containing protein [Streptomyces sp. SP18CS02]MEE1755480.1 DUF305 domain-containing protein [Streptomyces sp. SP18CS02]
MTAHRSPARRAAAVAATAVAAVVLAACAGDDGPAGREGHRTSSSPGAPASAPAGQGGHNAADVSFAQGMIPHHRQAVEMAELAKTRAASAEVEKLASEIEKAQEPEIRTLSGWLTAWGEDVPGGSPDGREGGEHAGHAMSGMMAPGEMDELEKSSGTAFDTAFLRMMVKHHEGAVEMARTEQAQGAHRPAKDMAGAIVTSQSAEITRMNQLLGSKS